MSSLFNIAAGGQAGFYDYQINDSLRLDNGASATLTRTPSSSSNRRTWTWSGWVKKTKDGELFKAVNGSAFVLLRFLSNTLDIVRFQNPTTFFRLQSSAVFRDPSAWYHIVVVFDTTQATASDRIQFYVNGSEITSFATASYPSQNSDWDVNLNVIHTGIGDVGYASDVNFIDGQALDPTSFGETKSGVWIPKDTSGLTFGTNGFRLEFGDSAAIGDDTSGNGNDYTANNLSAHDVVPDSPTLNYSTFNPLVNVTGGSFSEGNLKVTTGSSQYGPAVSSFAVSSGKWYCEFLTTASSGDQRIGGVRVGTNLTTTYDLGNSGSFAYRQNDGQKKVDGTQSAYGATWAVNDIIGMALNLDDDEVTFYKNGSSQGTFSITTGEYFLATSDGDSGAGMGAFTNFGQDSTFAGATTAGGNSDANGYGDFKYSVPSLFLALNSANLTEPSITPLDDDVPEDYFNTVLYTGTGSSRTISLGLDSDWSWIKSRSVTGSSALIDTVRGANKVLVSNSTASESTSIHIDGLGTTLSLTGSGYNSSSVTYVVWNWLAGGTAVSNTDGTITSSVSANTKAGFSIITYSGTGSSMTFGHGLGATPDFFVVKKRNGADEWMVYPSAATGNLTQFLKLNNGNTYASDSVLESLTSTVIGFGSSGARNNSGNTYLCYAFKGIEGYSKFGSYTGNGSADGTFVYTGFRPAWLLIKNVSASGDWILQDNRRLGYNVDNNDLVPNQNYAEATDDRLDQVSNGFKLRSTFGTSNTSGQTYIYMAFAEMPTKYANAR